MTINESEDSSYNDSIRHYHDAYNHDDAQDHDLDQEARYPSVPFSLSGPQDGSSGPDSAADLTVAPSQVSTSNQPTSPTDEYLRTSLAPSTPLDPLSPSPSRKLLILDLNGTLLFRSPRSPRGPRIHRNTHTAAATPAFRLRHVYPRPYLSSFRAYLFAPRTLTWLDTMVWSSAQPHSVNDMVNHCFKEEQNKLVAVWSRDTLGLAKEDYCACFFSVYVIGFPLSLSSTHTPPFLLDRKIQTVKDLTKPWSLLPLVSSRASPPSFSNEIHDTELLQTRSALSTILLDDSPLKAQLQPWNHLCIPEYVKHMRASDLQVWERERALSTNTTWPHLDGIPNKYDQTLLAVVGILDTIKAESNVAGWIRAGKLSGGGLGGDGDEVTFHDSREVGDQDEDDPPPGSKRKRNDKTDVISSVPPGNSSPPLTPSGSSSPPPQTTLDSEHPQTMWFEDPAVLEYWAAQGRKALEDLGIEIHAGIAT